MSKHAISYFLSACLGILALLLLILFVWHLVSGFETVILKNSVYKISKSDGHYYLVFNDPDYRKPLGGYFEVPYVYFQTMAEFKSDIENADFSEEELLEIYKFRPDNKGRIEIINIEKLYDCACPNDVELDYIYWNWGDSYSFALVGSTESTDQGETTLTGTFGIKSEAYFEMWFAEDYLDVSRSYDLISTESITDRNATVYKLADSLSNQTTKLIQYTIELENKTLYVQETYPQQSEGDSQYFSGVPHSIKVYGEDNGHYFCLDLSGFNTRPSVEWLSAFGVKEYVG